VVLLWFCPFGDLRRPDAVVPGIDDELPRPLAARRWYLPLLYLPFVAITPFVVYPFWVRAHNPMALGASPLTYSIWGSLTGAYLIAALAAIVWNYRRLKDVNERRRLRLLMAGFAAGIMAFLPNIAIGSTPLVFVIGSAYYGSPLPVMFSLLQVALPITVGYAILRHRIFDIRVIVRQGLQYAAARGLLLSLTRSSDWPWPPTCCSTAISRFRASSPLAGGGTSPWRSPRSWLTAGGPPGSAPSTAASSANVMTPTASSPQSWTRSARCPTFGRPPRE